MDKISFINVTPQTPCPICGHPDWCSYSEDGFRVICRRVETGSIKTASDASGAQYYVHLTETGKAHYQSRIEQDRAAAKTILQASAKFTHEFYSQLLSRLSLTSTHREALRARGLSDEEIDRLGYRSWPAEPPWKLAKALKDHWGLEACLSIPGFYYAEGKTRHYLTMNYRSGYIIPSINLDGQIQALITRSDKPNTGSKYILLSSKKRGGFTPSMECHTPTIEQRLTGTVRTVRITEGVLKADIATIRSGILTLGLQGLTWRRAIPTLQRLAPEKIIIAFDADASQNLHVAHAMRRFIEALRQELPAMTIGLEIWPIDWGKGIDDVLTGGFSTSILEVKEKIDAEIERIISLAQKSGNLGHDATDPDSVIEELNQKHAVISIGSNVVILRERLDPTNNRLEIDFLRKMDFQTLYENRTVTIQDENGNPQNRPAAKYWLSSPGRREYEQLIFAPGMPEDSRYFNLWRGFSCDPKPGDWSLFKSHIKENICSDDESLFQYVLAWMADAIQNPSERPGVALVLRGKQGTGKGIFCREFGSLFGQHFVHISQSKHLTGSFNGHLKDCLLLFADEAFWAGDKAGEGALKALITEPEFLIEMKGYDAIRMHNRVRLIIASNADWVIPAGIEERRFFVIDMADTHIQDHQYFSAITKQMSNGGREAMLYDLLHFDLSTINLRQIPKTNALLEQKIQSMNPIEQFWFQILQQGKFYPDDNNWREEIEKDKLYNLYQLLSNQAGISRRGFQTHFGIHIKRLCPDISEIKKTVPIYDQLDQASGMVRKRFWIIPTLDHCRSKFEQLIGSTIQWDRYMDNEEGNKDEFLPF